MSDQERDASASAALRESADSISPERWQRIKEVFTGALEHALGTRDAFLDNACGADYQLRREVESLLLAAANSAATGQVLPNLLQAASGTAYQAATRAALIPGTRLGNYEILSALGFGGMSEVYRARDLHLQREVAIKVLPNFVSAEPDRLRRFEQEARAAASLNHPHIVVIHAIEEAAGVHFIAMELVDGQTLDRMIPEGWAALGEIL